MTSLAIPAIGQGPRADALVRDVAAVLGADLGVLERGALDGLGTEDVAG